MKCIHEEITKVAEKWVGIKEIGSNIGFNNKEFQYLIESVGWKREQAWCTYFAELVWKQAYKNMQRLDVVDELNGLFSGSALQTYQSFRKVKGWEVGPQAIIGSIVIWQKYQSSKPTWMGHAGIVVGANHYNELFDTVEGNAGSGDNRDGDGIYYKKNKKLDFSKKTSGLVLIGFIYPRNNIKTS